jgi:hypothetical protein
MRWTLAVCGASGTDTITVQPDEALEAAGLQE